MSIDLYSPIVGVVMTGFTAPTYGDVLDIAPDINGKQFAMTSLGGTQAGVVAHSLSAPFTLTYVRPKLNKVLGKPNPVTGLLPNVPKNQHVFILRKAVIPLVGQPYSIMLGRLTLDVPAGADIADAPNVKAGISCLFGWLYAKGSGIGDTVISGVV